MPASPSTSAIPAPAILRAVSACCLAIATFLVAFAGLFLGLGVVTGFREINGSWAILILVLLPAAAVALTAVISRRLVRFLKLRAWPAHVATILLSLAACWLLVPSPFTFAP